MASTASISSQCAAVHTNTVIIGAGPAGLAVGACLRTASIPFVILEARERVGASWHNHYDRLHLHTVKRYSALPHAPLPREFPRYVPRAQFLDYLQDYERQFKLEPRFGEQVIFTQFIDSEWLTQTENNLYRSRHLVIATGHNRQPRLPEWPGQSTYRGTIMHSSSYRNGEAFRERQVLIVGLGNSGGEIAVDLHEHGARPAISVRGGVNVVPRDPLGIPIQVFAIFSPSLRPQLSDAATRPLWRLLIGDLAPYGLPAPPYGPQIGAITRRKIPVIDVGTVKLIKSGELHVFGGIERFTPDGVVFADGKEERFDAVILATGFRPGLETFLVDVSRVTDAEGYPLVSGVESAIPGLYFCGFRNVVTGLLREIGREAGQIATDIAQRQGPAKSGEPLSRHEGEPVPLSAPPTAR